ncbi:MAG: hypothetical protein OXI41_01805 [Chloroflexota bacterium]|nr:hypothetical protein [Chloroflexota bacterium]MDE2894188.1 hypothetical protein [Chloroflexota bacterium]
MSRAGRTGKGRHSKRQRRRKTPTRRVFYAYPADPPDLAETIAEAIAEIRTTTRARGMNLEFTPWPDLHVSGKNLLQQITAAIDRSDVVAFDVTLPNCNVAFELGYAVSQHKPVWLSLNPSFSTAQANFRLQYTHILNAGYHEYNNHIDLSDALYGDAPWDNLDDLLLPTEHTRRPLRSEHSSLLHLKPPTTTSAVIKVSEYLMSSRYATSIAVDDPIDNSDAPLSWYVENIQEADAVLVHLLSDNHTHADRHNAKASFVAGLAHGMSKQLLMVAHEPFKCPTDYQGLLRSHSTASSSVEFVREWIDSLEVPYRRRRRTTQERPKSTINIELRDLSLGEPVAENERWTLDRYFVETEPFYRAQEAPLSIFVGRRGSGKTATLYALDDVFRTNRRVHVCTVQPVGYELGGLIALLNEAWQVAQRGFLIESLWKFLLYTEIANSVASDIKNRPAHISPTESEARLLDYLQPYERVMLVPFSERVNEAVGALSASGVDSSARQQRLRISEHLHKSYIGQLERRLHDVFDEKDKVLVLIDKLDDRWGVGSDVDIQAMLLRGLIDVAQSIVDAFQGRQREAPDSKLSLVMFIRSDIFSHLGLVSAELDKLPVRRIAWSDTEELMGVLDQRLVHRGTAELNALAVWEKLFEQVEGTRARDFIQTRSLPRPRDILVFAREAVSTAIRRGSDRVRSTDLVSAYQAYSRSAFQSVLLEENPEESHLEAVLIELAGSNAELSEKEALSNIVSAGVPKARAEVYLELLCDINVLGVVSDARVQYPPHEEARRILLQRERRVARRTGGDGVGFVVHPAFHDVLGIRTET